MPSDERRCLLLRSLLHQGLSGHIAWLFVIDCLKTARLYFKVANNH